jgi:hypothetical protein
VKDKLTGAGRRPTSLRLFLFHIDTARITLISPRTSPRCLSANEVGWIGRKKSENTILPSYETNVVDGKCKAGEQSLSTIILTFK